MPSTLAESAALLLADGLPPAVLEVAGWVPAVVFPAATLLQLVVILRRKTAAGVSVAAWSAFAIANICLFLYTEKYGELESILGALGTALLNLCIVAAAIRYRNPAGGNPKARARV
jgi:uncharacterized protein with PQ loop repeat